MRINRNICIFLALVLMLALAVGCAESDVEQSSQATESSDVSSVAEQESSAAESYDAEPSDVESSDIESSDEPSSETSEEESSQDVSDVAPADDIINLAFAPDGFGVESYESYIDTELEYGSYLVLTPNTEVYDFEYFVLDFDSYFNDNIYVIDKVLYSCDKLTSAKPFLTKIYYPGYYGPFCGVSYTDKNGKNYRFVILESYEDGSYYLSAF